MDEKKDWIYRTNIYEVNVRQYTKEGTFAAFATHLPRLKDMGVDTLWFMPITPISQKEKKGTLGSYYASSDYTSVNPEFGTLTDFKLLVTQAHSLGMKVIIDWVANHTGWEHTWTKQHPEWYEKDHATGDFKRASGMDDIIELDFSNDAMRKAMMEAMKFWVSSCNIDGYRCDLAFWVPLDFWLVAIPYVNQVKPLFWLAESDPLEHPEYMQAFDAAYTWTWMHKTEEFHRQKFSIQDLIKIPEQYQRVPGMHTWFTSNHDENTWNGTEYEKYGQGAAGLAVFSCTWPGIPLVYSGQELPNLKRLKFFDKDVIEWKDTYELHGFYKILLALHHSDPALQHQGEIFRIHTSADTNIFGFVRKKGKAEVIVMLNFRDHKVRFDLLSGWINGTFKEIFSGTIHDFSKANTFEMGAWSFLVYTNSFEK